MKNLILVAVAMMVTSGAFASGFKCEGEGYRVKIFNKLDATRTPAVLILSHVEDGTIVKADAEDIQKYNGTTSVRYTVEDTDSWDLVTIRIVFKEGKEVLEAGEEVDASLLLRSGNQY